MRDMELAKPIWRLLSAAIPGIGRTLSQVPLVMVTMKPGNSRPGP